MKTTFLEFEQPIAELENRIEELRFVQDDSAVDISEEIQRLSKRSQTLTKEIYGKLSPWQMALVARHPQRPYTLDYVGMMFTHFEELHGDRSFSDDPAIVAGLARFNGEPCVVIGHQKGRDTKEKILRNFGMPRPEGYRKALRVMKLAEKFGLPVFTFVDTPGAYPGIDAEERGQSEAIGRNLFEMAKLRTPIIATVIGCWSPEVNTMPNRYSFQMVVKVQMALTARIGPESGSTTLRKMRQNPAPSICPALMISSGRPA